MEKIKKLFGKTKMPWKNVIVFAILTAIYTALINEIPFLKDTSFRDIAINLECWILFAVFIIVNCEKIWEAVLKCFVFFLISQPLIYLIEVPFEPLGWGVFVYYKHWFMITLLTLPGAAIAFLLKKKNFISALILSFASGFLAYSFTEYGKTAIFAFPRHILSALFCLFLSVFFAFVLLDKKPHRIFVLLISSAVICVSVFLSVNDSTKNISLEPGDWTYSVSDEKIVKVEKKSENDFRITAKKNGYATLFLKDQDGNICEYEITVTGGSIWISSEYK